MVEAAAAQDGGEGVQGAGTRCEVDPTLLLSRAHTGHVDW